MTGPEKPDDSRYRNGSFWRDPDIVQVLTVCACACLLSAGTVYLWFLARTWRTAATAPCGIDAAASVIVFGKRPVDGEPDREFHWRLRRALCLLRRHPWLPLILAGGSGAGIGASEAEIAQRWLLRHMPEAAPRLRLETRSRDTIDNLRQARAMLPAGPVALVSNRYHLARCRMLAGSLGIDARVCAAEPRLCLDRRNLGRIVLEAGYHTLFVVGRGWARLTGNRRMLARVS